MKRRMRHPGILSALLLAAVNAAAAGTLTSSLDLVVDVPTDLPGLTVAAGDIAHYDPSAASYTLGETLPGAPPINALHRMDVGDWLFAIQCPANLGGVDYETRDLLRFDGVSYSVFFDGSSVGIPESAAIDAAFLAGGDGGDPVVSFVVPTDVNGTTYLPSDLVRFTAGVDSRYFDGADVGIPLSTNVVGADESAGGVAFSFDVPTHLGGTTYVPGQIVDWDGVAFSPLHDDAGWPLSSRIFGFSLSAPSADVPGSIGTSLMLAKITPGGASLGLSWAASCGTAAANYGVYEGALGNWTSHTQVDCTDDGGDLTEVVAPAAGSRYFLVVPHDDAAVEGSYGRNGDGVERDPGAATCQVLHDLGECP